MSSKYKWIWDKKKFWKIKGYIFQTQFWSESRFGSDANFIKFKNRFWSIPIDLWKINLYQKLAKKYRWLKNQFCLIGQFSSIFIVFKVIFVLPNCIYYILVWIINYFPQIFWFFLRPFEMLNQINHRKISLKNDFSGSI